MGNETVTRLCIVCGRHRQPVRFDLLPNGRRSEICRGCRTVDRVTLTLTEASARRLERACRAVVNAGSLVAAKTAVLRALNRVEER